MIVRLMQGNESDCTDSESDSYGSEGGDLIGETEGSSTDSIVTLWLRMETDHNKAEVQVMFLEEDKGHM